jgi:predicted Fe-Mo cluster-binding NifX family protein
MRIAVAVERQGHDSDISPQAGRARYYLVFDEEGGPREVLKNPFSVGGGGAGFGVAKMLADKRIDVAVAEKFGSKMKDALEDRGIRAFELSGAAHRAPAEVLGS